MCSVKPALYFPRSGLLTLCNKAAINTVLCGQFFMLSLLHDFAAVQRFNGSLDVDKTLSSSYNTYTPNGKEDHAMRQCMDAENLHRRLKKIIGQVQAIDRMIDEDVPCEDILSQLNAAKSALNGCGKVVLEGHIKHCVRDGIEHGDADKTIESFTKAVERFANMQ